MTEREKMIKGLSACMPETEEDAKIGCEKCPYQCGGNYQDNDHVNLPLALVRDICALLKVQEPRVMTLVEVRALQDDTVVWLEDNDKTDVIPAIVNHVWNSLPNIVSFTLKNMREVKADMLWYGVKWRCWTSRPTDEQRRAIPWET